MFKSSDVSVELIDWSGTDLSVVNAARVSFNKESDYILTETVEDGYTRVEWELPAKDKKLLKYLADHNHWTPFAHCFMSMRIRCCIAVARQLHKHQVGLVVNEVSRRYVSEEPTFYVPEVLRGKAKNKKQGSEGTVPRWDYGFMDEGDFGPVEWVYQHALDAYTEMLERGVCEEQARLVLPLGVNTEFIWSGSLAAWARVVNLRTSQDAQAETREVAEKIAEIVKSQFPESYNVLCGQRSKTSNS